MDQKTYERTPLGRYRRQKANAERRHIPWDFTFESWWKIWQDSGKWEQRGQTRDSYCMSRINDEGHYCPENVEIKTLSANTLEHLSSRWTRNVDTWQPYPRTSAWEYTWQGHVYNRIEEKT